MKPPHKPFDSLTAADVMGRVSVLIPHRMSMPDAARLLSRRRSQGAAVIDGAGRCVGLLAGADFLRWIGHGEGEDRVQPACVWSDWQVVEETPKAGDEV